MPPKKKINEETEDETFPQYITRKQALETNNFFQGTIRINKANPNRAEVHSLTSKKTLLLETRRQQNRALDGDQVLVDSSKMEVVFITHKLHSRKSVGFLKYMNKKWALFVPRDQRVPRMKVYAMFWPKHRTSLQWENLLLIGVITVWDSIKRISGKIIECVGIAGDLDSERLGILRAAAFNTEELVGDVSNITKKLPSFPREDLTKMCSFTVGDIMDGALSCQKLKNGNYEIGVHVPDVTYYLKEGSTLDELVKNVGNSIKVLNYTQEMFPQKIVRLCCLEIGFEKPTFSVIFQITLDGNIVFERVTRSTVKICVSLSFLEAQQLIDKPEKVKLNITNGFTVKQVADNLSDLFKVSKKLSEFRNKDIVKSNRKSLDFQLDNFHRPVGIVTKKKYSSQDLVEEFIIFTNVTVGRMIMEKFPHLALLRSQEIPFTNRLTDLRNILINFSLIGKFDSRKSCDEFIAKCDDDRQLALNAMFDRCFRAETYFCRGTNQVFPKFSYCHFTSPIRRYADIVSHRLLSATLGQFSVENLSPTEIAEICNNQELKAKEAIDATFNLYLAYFIEKNQPFQTDAIVIKVFSEFFLAIVGSIGRTVKVNKDSFDRQWKCESKEISTHNRNKRWTMTITFQKRILVLDLFTKVRLSLTKSISKNQLDCKLIY